MTPLQLGIPYSRPRYYALGRRKCADGSCMVSLATLPPGGCPHPGPPGRLIAPPLEGRLQAAALHEQPAPAAAAGDVKVAPISAFLDDVGLPSLSACAEGRAETLAPLLSALQGIVKQLPGTNKGAAFGAPVAGNQHAAERTVVTNGGTSELSPDSSAQGAQPHRYEHVGSCAASEICQSPEIEGAQVVGQQAQQIDNNEHQWVPQNVIEQWGTSLHIVAPDSRRCNCFTKTYFRWVKASPTTKNVQCNEQNQEWNSLHAKWKALSCCWMTEWQAWVGACRAPGQSWQPGTCIL